MRVVRYGGTCRVLEPCPLGGVRGNAKTGRNVRAETLASDRVLKWLDAESVIALNPQGREEPTP